MLSIGLTGGIGSGKSTVAQIFSEYGITIIDADIIAHNLTEPPSPAYDCIVQHFGKEILLDNQQVDRKKLRHQIFQDTKARQWLENMLHPLIRQEIQNQIKLAVSPYCIIVIPLLFETLPTANDAYGFLNRILVVDTQTSLQIKRTTERDKSDANTINAILDTQVSRKVRLTGAQDIITNDGKLADLIPQVEKLHQQYLKLSTS